MATGKAARTRKPLTKATAARIRRQPVRASAAAKKLLPLPWPVSLKATMIVPTLHEHVAASSQFGAWKLPVKVSDPGGTPGTGLVVLRGVLQFSPLYTDPSPYPKPLFTLPPGMRPACERLFACAHLPLLSVPAQLLVVHVAPNGLVSADMPTVNMDATLFMDGISFLAEQ